MSWHLAQINIGNIIAPQGDPRVQPFFDALDRVNALAETSRGVDKPLIYLQGALSRAEWGGRARRQGARRRRLGLMASLPPIDVPRDATGKGEFDAPAAGEPDSVRFDYLLRLGDDALVLGQRLGE